MQPLLMPVCNAVVLASPAIEKSPETRWQVAQDWVVGIWPVGLAAPLK